MQGRGCICYTVGSESYLIVLVMRLCELFHNRIFKHHIIFEKFVQRSASVRVYFSLPVEVFSSELGSMSFLQYFQHHSLLPTPQQMGISERATTEANSAVVEVIGDSGHSNSRKRKCNSAFSDKNRAVNGKHVAKNSNVSALKLIN